MSCKREDRFRHNTIAFWLSDDEKNQVEARIILSGLQKGQYYRKAILEQRVEVIAGNYMSVRVAAVLNRLVRDLEEGKAENMGLLLEVVKRLLEVNSGITDV